MMLSVPAAVTLAASAKVICPVDASIANFAASVPDSDQDPPISCADGTGSVPSTYPFGVSVQIIMRCQCDQQSFISTSAKFSGVGSTYSSVLDRISMYGFTYWSQNIGSASNLNGLNISEYPPVEARPVILFIVCAIFTTFMRFLFFFRISYSF